jgi:hypothetical protein
VSVRGVDASESWTYETIVNSIPGVRVSNTVGYAVQLLGFAAAVVVLWVAYGLPTRVLWIGLTVVAVATLGSGEMIYISDVVRSTDASERYRRLLFNSQIELVMGLVAFFIFVVYLFVVNPRAGGGLLEYLLGDRPPALVVFTMLVLVWDVCYRIGTAWWAAVCGLWRAVVETPAAATRRPYRRLDLVILLFSVSQLVLLWVTGGDWFLTTVLVGHVGAVTVVTALVVGIERWKRARLQG